MFLKISSIVKLVFLKLRFGKRLGLKSFRLQFGLGTEIFVGKKAFLSMGKVSSRTNVHLLCDEGEMHIGDGVFFNSNCIVVCRHKIKIGYDCMFGPNVCVYDHDHVYTADDVSANEFKCSEIIIEDGCWIGAGVIILRGTHIGRNTIIEAGSVVKGNIPSDAIVTTIGKMRSIPRSFFAGKSKIQEAISAARAADDNAAENKSIVTNHNSIKLEQIPLKWIEEAKKNLHIAYGHTSHGSQIISGLVGLTEFKKSPYVYKKGSPQASLDLRDNPFSEAYLDLGQPDNKTWALETGKYLDGNNDINVVMWSWCGQLSSAGKRYVENYLSMMQKLEKQYPRVTFVYMTGHLDGSGENGTLARNNKRIREFCLNNGKVLYDFADIESYDPDGKYFGGKHANDACDYGSGYFNRKPDKNWAKEWQDSHKAGVDWYQCESAHSQPVNANMKAYAAWWLMARLVGWDGIYEAAAAAAAAAATRQ